MSGREPTSRIWFFCGSLTLPARQQWEIALWMIGLFDLALGSLNSLGPGEDKQVRQEPVGQVKLYLYSADSQQSLSHDT